MALGCIVIYLNPQGAGFSGLDAWLETVRKSIPGVEITTKLEATDEIDENERPYRYEYLVQVSDIDAVSDKTLKTLGSEATSLLKDSDWNIFRGISFDKEPNFNNRQTPPSQHAAGCK